MNDSSSSEDRMSDPRSSGERIGLIVVLALLLGSYALVRFGPARGTEGDTAAFTVAIRHILDTGKLVPETLAYPNGYGYQILIVLLSKLTAAPIGSFQVIGGGMLLTWVVIPAWLAYREFTRSEIAASLAVLILLAQPEFLFPLLRGTHEKFTRGLMFLLLFLLLRSMRAKDARVAASLIVAFYLLAYALMTMNNLMASSFLMAIGLALLLIWAAQRILPHQRQAYATPTKKLPMVILSLLAISFLVTFYTYPPAQSQLRIEVRPYDWTRKWSKIMKRRGGLAWRPGRSRLLWGVDPIVSEIDGMSSQLCRAGLPSQPLALELGRGQVS